jgi:hypothetical protein
LPEASDIMRRRVIVDERVDLISDLLHELEAAHLIQSTDGILDVANAAGRNMERQRPRWTIAITMGRA